MIKGAMAKNKVPENPAELNMHSSAYEVFNKI